MSREDRRTFRSRLEAVIPSLAFACEGFLPGAVGRDDLDPAPVETADALGAAVAEFPRAIDEVVGAAVKPVRRWLDTLRYLGPLRTYPDRGWALTDQRDAHWIAGGGEAWEALRISSEVRDYVNQFLAGDGSGYTFQLRDYLEKTAAQEAAEERLEEFRAALFHQDSDGVVRDPDTSVDLSDADADVLRDIVIRDIRNRIDVSPRDIGVGISQLVPVLALAYGLQRKTILIEQPEIHVHPRLQAALGDVFLRTALLPKMMRNRYIIETHSENLILRMLRRIRETTLGKQEPERPGVRVEDVCLLYVDPSRDGSVVRRIRIDKHGRLIDPVPGGFFEENFSEMFS